MDDETPEERRARKEIRARLVRAWVDQAIAITTKFESGVHLLRKRYASPGDHLFELVIDLSGKPSETQYRRFAPRIQYLHADYADEVIEEFRQRGKKHGGAKENIFSFRVGEKDYRVLFRIDEGYDTVALETRRL